MLRQDPIDELTSDPTAQELEPDPRRAISPPRPEPRLCEPAGKSQVIKEPRGHQALEHGLDLIGGIFPLDQPPPELGA